MSRSKLVLPLSLPGDLPSGLLPVASELLLLGELDKQILSLKVAFLSKDLCL